MLMTIYKRAFKVMMSKPLKLWGLSLLAILLSSVAGVLCGAAIPVLGLSVGFLLTTSMTLIFLRGYRGEEVHTVQLFECFKDWQTIKRVLLGMGWMALWIFLWCLIPIVGFVFAIIRLYEYRLTPYILVFEPDVPITEAINVSKTRTNGYKAQMFLADFIYIAGFIVACVLLGLLCSIPVVKYFFMFVAFVFVLAFYALAPLFAGLVQAAFYEEITNPSVAAPTTCLGCGSKLAPNSAFCPVCGKPVQ